MKTPHKISILATLNRTRHFAKRSISMVAMIGTIVIASIQGQAGNYAINGNFEKTGTNATVITTGLIEDSHGNVKKATFESEGYLVQQIIHDTAGGSNGALMVSIPATRHCHANSGNHGLFIEHHNIVGGSRVRVEFDAKWIDGPSKYLNVKRPWSPTMI